MKSKLKKIIFFALFSAILAVTLIYFFGCDYFTLLSKKEWEDRAGIDTANNYLYVLNSTTSKSISAFKINYKDESLNQITGSPFTVSTPLGFPGRFTVDKSGNFIYCDLYGGGTNNISVLYVQNDGVLKNMASSPSSLKTANHPGHFLIVDPFSRFLYSSTQNMVISICDLDKSTGKITEKSNSPLNLSGGCLTQGLSINNSGEYLLTHNVDGYLRSFKINQSNGSLELVMQLLTTTQTAEEIELHPTNDYFYLGNRAGGTTGLYGFKFNKYNGTFSQLPGFPYLSGSAVLRLEINPNGKYLYACAAALVYVFEINESSGALIQTGNFTFVTQINDLGVDPTGKFLFACENNSPYNIHAIKLGNNGRDVKKVFTISNPAGSAGTNLLVVSK